LDVELSVYFHRHTQFHFTGRDPRVFEKCLKEGLFTQPFKKLAVSVYIDPDFAQHYPDEEARLRAERYHLACLDDLLKYPTNNNDLAILICTERASQNRTKDFRKTLNIVFPRMTRLRDAGYSITLVLDPDTASHLHGDFRSEVVLTPKNVEFSIKGYVDGLRRVRQSQTWVRMGPHWLLHSAFDCRTRNGKALSMLDETCKCRHYQNTAPGFRSE